MIIRQFLLRQGRRTLASPLTLPVCRPLTNSVDVDKTAASLQNSEKEVHSIESMINSATPPGLPFVTPVAGTEKDESIAAEYNWMRRQKRLANRLGSVVSGRDQAPTPQSISLELLLASEAHLGHSTSLWNPANQRYIFGIRQGIHIISLDIIATHLRRASKIVSSVCERGGLVLFVGTRPGQRRIVVDAAKAAEACHLFDKWIPGSITNGQQILGRCRMKVVDQFDRELPGYEEALYHRTALKPDLVVCFNPLENYVLLYECRLNNIPTIGIIDTDANPTWVTYPIPANDDSLSSVDIIATVLGKAGGDGQNRRRAAAEAGEITYEPDQSLGRPSRNEAGED